MESSAAKQQPMAGGSMTTAEQTYWRTELEQRGERLHEALHSPAADASLSELLTAVDTALSRIDQGTFGLCETCQDAIEAERLLADPLVRFCLDHLTSAEQRALESDLSLAARIQRALLPKLGLAPAGWDVRYHYQPAGVVSGDYCDLFETDGGLLFALGDVSGKGVAASMLMSHLHAMFRSLAEAGLPLAQGDTLFLYADGLTEARNRAGAEYGLHRIRTLAARHTGIEPAGLISECLEDLQSFGEGLKQPDDLTLLAVQRAE